MRSRSRFAAPFVALAVVLAVVAAACGGDGGDGGSKAAPAASSSCPVDALASAPKPVTIDFWYQSGGSSQQAAADLVAQFNASQHDVRVRTSVNPTYQDTITKWRASLAGGAQPDLVQLEETTVRQMVDSRSAVPIGDCVKADGYDLSDYLPRAIDYYSADGKLQAMAWNVSNPVLYYNKAAFRAAGLDPEKPPTTFDEVTAMSQQLVAKGVVKHGIALKILPYYVEFWLAKAGQTYVNNDNGRAGRATKATLDNATGRAIFSWWDEIVKSGLGLNVGTGADPDHLLALANKNAAMTIEASSAIGPVLDVLNTGQYPGLELGIAALPGLEPDGGVPVGDGALWISAKSSPAEKAAAWTFVKWLDEPAQQATLHVRTGSVPIRKSAIDRPEVQQFWRDKPFFRVAYDQLEQGPRTPATSGSLIGDYQGVRDAVVNAITAMLSKGLAPGDAVKQAQANADSAIAAYNQRVG